MERFEGKNRLEPPECKAGKCLKKTGLRGSGHGGKDEGKDLH